MPPVRTLILGHSFIRRLRDFRALHISLNTNLHGTRDETVSKARALDLGIVKSFRPDIVILQLGSNDFVHGDPLSIASAIVESLYYTILFWSNGFVSAKPFIEYRALHLISVFEIY